MEELVKIVSEEAGLSTNFAKTAVLTVVENLKNELTVAELIKLVSEKTGLSTIQARKAVHIVINSLIKFPLPLIELC